MLARPGVTIISSQRLNAFPQPAFFGDRPPVASTKTPKVFISSTLEDLKEFREKAREAILRLGWQPIDCAYWAAAGNPPLATCLEKVDEADVLIAIVAHRHGWTPPDQATGEHKSITRLECERARASRKCIEVIPFFVDERASWDAKLTETNRINEADADRIAEVADEVGRNVQALKDFKAWLDAGGMRKLFSNPDQLATEVLHALSEWGERRGFKQASRHPTPSVRERYLAWLRRTCETVELLGLDLKETQNVRLGQVYVPAVTAPKAREAQAGTASALREQRHRPPPAPARRRIALRPRRARRRQIHVLPLGRLGGRERRDPGPSDWRTRRSSRSS